MPNTQIYTPREFKAEWRLWERNIQALGQEHPNRIPIYCDLLARVARIDTGEDPNGGGRRDMTSYFLTQFAIRLDRPGNRCLASMIAAVPEKPRKEAIMQEWAIPCLRTIRRCQAQLDPPLR